MHLLKKIWVQIRDIYFYFFRNAIIINGYVDDLTWLGIRHRNWGDDLNYYLIPLISGRAVIFYHHFWLARKLRFKNYLCIGTLLDAVNYSNPQTIVWGSGVSGQERTFVLPKKILSVRGKKTREFLTRYQIDSPNVLGDPALLLPLYYTPPSPPKKYKLGIIPHVVDLDYPAIQEIQEKFPHEVLILNLARYKKWTDIIDQISTCECIASSSLHGLIVSDAYGIPNCWIELSGNLSGGYFKFYDYASSVQRLLVKPYSVSTSNDIASCIKLCKEWKTPLIDTQSILQSCPFYKKEKHKRKSQT